MTARMTGFSVESNGDVYLLVDLGAGAHRVLLSRTMLAGIAEASAEMVLSGVFAGTSSPPETERTYYVQVDAPGNKGRTLTFKADYPVEKGSTVLLPPLPWMRRNWLATVTGTERGTYAGEIRSIIGAITGKI